MGQASRGPQASELHSPYSPGFGCLARGPPAIAASPGPSSHSVPRRSLLGAPEKSP